jgi:four helix bundle protein
MTLSIYKLTDRFPRSEMFGLSSQLRPASTSVATNLAEGCGRTQAEFGRFVQISFGSAGEVEYQLLLANDLGFLSAVEYEALNNADQVEAHVELIDEPAAKRCCSRERCS